MATAPKLDRNRRIARAAINGATARELASQYLDGSRMIWLVVGDAETQLERLRELGMGEPIRVDREGAVYFAGG